MKKWEQLKFKKVKMGGFNHRVALAKSGDYYRVRIGMEVVYLGEDYSVADAVYRRYI